MSQTLLELVQAAQGELGLFPLPSAVASATDNQTQQFMALANSLGKNLVKERAWQALQTQYRFNVQSLVTTGNISASGATTITGLGSVAGITSDSTWSVTGNGVQQDTYVTNITGATATLSLAANAAAVAQTYTFCKLKYAMPADYDRLQPRTDYDKSKHWEMLGPTSPQNAEWLKSGYISTGPRLRYWIQGGFYNIWPIVSTNDLLGFQYISKNWASSSAGAGQQAFAADTDTCVYPDVLMTAGLKLKYFAVKGFDTTALLAEFTRMLGASEAQDSDSPTLSFAPRNVNELIGYEQIPDSGYGV